MRTVGADTGAWGEREAAGSGSAEAGAARGLLLRVLITLSRTWYMPQGPALLLDDMATLTYPFSPLHQHASTISMAWVRPHPVL
jgi:hypothetical protein